MIRNDVQDELADGFEPSPLPAMGTDGGFEPPPPAKISDPPPRLCEQGPCQHYHRLDILMDSAKPLAERLGADGKVSGIAPEVRDHIETHHYCYPTVGVETRLGSLPVVGCNRWDPKVEGVMGMLDRTRSDFLRSPAGKRYKSELEAWEARFSKEIAAEAAAMDAAAVAAAAEIAAAAAARANGKTHLEMYVEAANALQQADLAAPAADHTVAIGELDRLWNLMTVDEQIEADRILKESDAFKVVTVTPAQCEALAAGNPVTITTPAIEGEPKP